MVYDFRSLSPADFEDLVRDLVGREFKVRFEAFAPGPDGGIDGRHAVGPQSTILQAKHYLGSSYSALKSAMIKERISIDSLKPNRYCLATSRPLSPLNKDELAKVIGPALKSQADIFGPNDLNSLLRKFPDVEKANIKLWLSSSAVLEQVIRAAEHTFTALSREDIEAKLKVYAQNPSFQIAKDKLESEHVLIIAGPPGVGKTTLAEMLSYSFIADGWEFRAIKDVSEGLSALTDSRKQIFFFDDFLGRAALDTNALTSKDSVLARFIKRIRASRNARFILTTRAPIFEQARRISEHLADKSLDVTKYLLDVGVYTRRIRARILYNHLVVSGISQRHIRSLWQAGAVSEIVDHKNYNPRIIEAMTDKTHLLGMKPQDYPHQFIDALNNPERIWDIAFRKHIPPMCRHLMYALFFCSEYGVSIGDLRIIFGTLHSFLCKKYLIEQDPRDFEESIRILEGGFIEIKDKRVSFVNPSVRDYLISYLDDPGLLADFAVTARKGSWARSLWHHVQHVKEMSLGDQRLVAHAFVGMAQRLLHSPSQSATGSFDHDLTNSNRIDLLLSWHEVVQNPRFLKAAVSLIEKPVEGFTAWNDGRKLVEIICSLQDGTYSPFDRTDELKSKLERAVIEILDGYVWPDDLETIVEAVEAAGTFVSDDVGTACDRAILREVEEIDSMIANTESESTLEDHPGTLWSPSGRDRS
jgi:hypothetical protein